MIDIRKVQWLTFNHYIWMIIDMIIDTSHATCIGHYNDIIIMKIGSYPCDGRMGCRLVKTRSSLTKIRTTMGKNVGNNR